MLDAFFALLRSALWGEPLSDFRLLSDEQWDELLKMAKKQTVLGLIADAVSRLPEQSKPSRRKMTSLLKYSTRQMMTYDKLDSAVAQVVDFYRSRGIECVLLKGQGIARCYPAPQLRTCGDIDLYIGIDNYAKSVELAKESLESDPSESAESIRHYGFTINGIEVELHRLAAQMMTPGRSSRLQRWLVSELEDDSRLRCLDINGVEVLVPSADFDVFFIFYHAFWHLLQEGVGLRQICDWTMVIRRNIANIDRRSLEQRLERFRLVKMWQIMGAIAVEHLGLPSDMMPLYDPTISSRYPWVMDRVVSCGNFGAHGTVSESQRKKMPFARSKFIKLQRQVDTYGKMLPIIPLESTCFMAWYMTVSAKKVLKELIRGK